MRIEAVSCQHRGNSESPWVIQEAVTDVKCLRKQEGVCSTWFLLPRGSHGSLRGARAAPASWKWDVVPPQADLPCQPQGAMLTEVRGDVLTQSEPLGAYSGESFLSWVSVPPQERRPCIGRWVHAQCKYLSQTKYDHSVNLEILLLVLLSSLSNVFLLKRSDPVLPGERQRNTRQAL